MKSLVRLILLLFVGLFGLFGLFHSIATIGHTKEVIFLDSPTAKTTGTFTRKNTRGRPPASKKKIASVVYAVQTGAFPCKNGVVLIKPHYKQKGSFWISSDKLRKRYLLKIVPSVSGAVRLEDGLGEMVFLQLANKSMLLDVKSGKRLMNGCQSIQQIRFAKKMRDQPDSQRLLSGLHQD